MGKKKGEKEKPLHYSTVFDITTEPGKKHIFKLHVLSYCDIILPGGNKT